MRIYPIYDLRPQIAVGCAPYQHPDVLDGHAGIPVVPQQPRVGAPHRLMKRHDRLRRDDGASLVRDTQSWPRLVGPGLRKLLVRVRLSPTISINALDSFVSFT